MVKQRHFGIILISPPGAAQNTEISDLNFVYVLLLVSLEFVSKAYKSLLLS